MDGPSNHEGIKRKLSLNCDEDEQIQPYKYPCNMDYSLLLPNEMLVEIFSYLSHEDLYRRVRPTCRRWKEVASSSVLWKNLVVEKKVPERVVCSWLKNAPLLKEIYFEDRRNIDLIVRIIAKYCKKLEVLTIRNPDEGKDVEAITSHLACRMVTNCQNLRYINMLGVKIKSGKFLQLLIDRIRSGADVKFRYSCHLNNRQLKTLAACLRNQEQPFLGICRIMRRIQGIESDEDED